ncbi:prepilin-type N-terminal cleavage/methylation domain-containing protein [Lapidilactobacillus bayanensis]|uniref:prepilin-type N-terminal cleavage/methylation domain-containing protein n=1 Tax=Lapidilactobacillus bayanensis TaxID=2485998 RepID=UPI000F7A47CC|nr:prepilin-type N-terminal cleavage/methylation domain-containing protein [Lapidilactobacillus bayanensis]
MTARKSGISPAFTLVEMSLTLFILSSLLLIGTHYYRPPTAKLSEELAIKAYKRAWDSAVNYSVTHQTNVYIVYDKPNKIVRFETGEKDWQRTVQFPPSITFGSNATFLASIVDGKTKKPMTIVFMNNRDGEYKLTAQLYWGRLNVKTSS